MQDNEKEKVELDDCPDFQSVVDAFEDFHNSLELSEEELTFISSKTPDNFEDVKFELLPSYEEKEVYEDMAHKPRIIKSLDDPFSLPFTLREQDEVIFDQNQEIVNPILFRFVSDETMWLLDHHEENLFRFCHYKGKELLHSFTIPRGSEKFCIGYPGGILIDRENNLFILDVEQQSVHKFSSEGEYDSHFQDQFVRQDIRYNLRDFDIMEDEGILLISDFVRCSVRKVSLEGYDKGEIQFQEEADGFYLDCVTGVAALGNGHFSVIDPIQKLILEFDLAGNLSEIFPLEPRSQIEIPFCSQMQANKDSFLFLADYETQEIHAYNPLGQLKGVFCTGPQSILPDIHLGYFDVGQKERLFFLNRLTKHIHCLQYHFVE